MSFNHLKVTLQSSVENLPPQVIRKVTKEVLQLAETPPEGIKVYVNEADLTDIQATIEGPGMVKIHCFVLILCCLKICLAGTPYEGGMFKMKLVLGRDFPAAPPQGME